MTRCTEFYEKLEKDGNFCGMTERAYKRAMMYWTEYRAEEERKGTKVLLSLSAWFNQQKITVEAHKQQTKGLLRGKKPNEAIIEEVVKTIEQIPDRTNREEIEECIKTLVLYEFDEDIIKLVKHNAIKVIARVELVEKMEK